MAIKTVPREHVVKAGVHREKSLFRSVSSDKLVKILTSYHTVQSIIVVSEWMAGGSLFQKLIESDYYSEATVMSYMNQVHFTVY